jgi:hypothetical protein
MIALSEYGKTNRRAQTADDIRNRIGVSVEGWSIGRRGSQSLPDD